VFDRTEKQKVKRDPHLVEKIGLTGW